MGSTGLRESDASALSFLLVFQLGVHAPFYYVRLFVGLSRWPLPTENGRGRCVLEMRYVRLSSPQSKGKGSKWT
eukprot:scaffold223_cov96-Skeletonema_dohrnii-CCMP3373.AAC.10